jgi:glutathione S-transferase
MRESGQKRLRVTMKGESSMKFYDMKMAPNPRRVRMFLAEKGISVESVQVDILAGENQTPAYLAKNPRGLVPMLELDDGTVLDESVAICRYFEELHPEPNLMGRTPLEKAQIESWQRRVEFDGVGAIASIFRNVAPQFAGHAVPGVTETTEQIPALAERGALLIALFWRDLDARLGTSAYVAGDRFTIADITAFICIEFAKWVKSTPGPEFANIARWYAEVSARPSAKA